MSGRNIASVVALLAVLSVLAVVLLASMSWVSDRSSTVAVPSATPALTDAFTIVTSKGPTAETEPTVSPTRTPVPYNSNSWMYLVFAGFDLSPGFGPLNNSDLGCVRENSGGERQVAGSGDHRISAELFRKRHH